MSSVSEAQDVRVLVPVRAARPSARRVTGAVFLGVLTAGAVVAGRLSGLLLGAPGLLLVALSLLAVPSARDLSRRVLLNGTIALGMLSLAWWLPVPRDAGRVTLVSAAVLGVLVTWMWWVPGRVGTRARRLVPRTRLSDAPMGLTALLAAYVVAPWWKVANAGEAMRMFVLGWDHSAHYAMAQMLRQHGVVAALLDPPPDGTTWAYSGYPPGAAAVLATVTEAQLGPRPLSADVELVVYAHALAVLTVLTCVLVTSAVCALPGLRNRAGLWPIALLPACVLLLGPGARILLDGFPNLLLCCGFLAVLPALAVQLERVHQPFHVAAIGAAVVGVAQSWALLLLVAAAFVVPCVVPLDRRRWRGTRGAVAVTWAVGIVTTLGVGTALGLLAGTQLSDQLVLGGAIRPPALRELGWLAAAALLLPLVLAAARPWAGPLARRGRVLRCIALVVVPVVGLASAGLLAWWQLRDAGWVSYYFWKYSTGVVAAGTGVVAVVLGTTLALRPAPTRRSRRLALPLAVLAAVAVTQAFGSLVPWRAVPTGGWAVRDALQQAVDLPNPATDRVVQAAMAPGVGRRAAVADGRPVVFISDPLAPGMGGSHAAQWYLALTASWTDGSNPAIGQLGPDVGDPVGDALTVLRRARSAVVVVDPVNVARVREAAGDQAGRVATW
ncbi:hypothetical protein ACTHAM_002770 [Cellulomonas soli]|uniref:hypothetical protein n=1 Tax=Cellulomonas soli TaxID=931535 RepID=UPI003F82B8DE